MQQKRVQATAQRFHVVGGRAMMFFALKSRQKQEVHLAEIPFYMHLLSSAVMQGIGQKT